MVIFNDPLVANLSATLSIKRCSVEYHVKHLFILVPHLPVSCDPYLVGVLIISCKQFTVILLQNSPVALFCYSSFFRTLFLLFHLSVETLLLHSETLFAHDQFRQVDRETICIIQLEGLPPVQLVVTLLQQ